jgi:hypothetical protein
MCARLLPLLKLLLPLIFDFESCGGSLRLLLGFVVSLFFGHLLNTLIKSQANTLLDTLRERSSISYSVEYGYSFHSLLAMSAVGADFCT